LKVIYAFLVLAFPIIGIAHATYLAYPEDIQTDFLTQTNPLAMTSKIFIADIPLGSQIQSTTMIIALAGDVDKKCTLNVIDNLVDEIPLANEFPCNGVSNIDFTFFGNSIIQTQLNMPVKMTVKSSDNLIVESFVLSPTVKFTAPTYFAKVENGLVTNVIVADIDFVSTQSGTWVETKEGQRANSAGIGFTYDSINDVFIAPKPSPFATLNENYQWVLPIIVLPTSPPISNSTGGN
jgi:hypothetical protein